MVLFWLLIFFEKDSNDIILVKSLSKECIFFNCFPCPSQRSLLEKHFIFNKLFYFQIIIDERIKQLLLYFLNIFKQKKSMLLQIIVEYQFTFDFG